LKAYRGLVFKRYVVSYLTVVLTVCLALGSALTLVASNQLKQSESELYQGRLANAASYIERQIAAMEDIRLSIKTTYTFQPSYVQQNVIREMELIEALSHFSSYSTWVEEYYLWYCGSRRVYGYSGGYDEEVFFRYVLAGLTEDEQMKLIDSTINIAFILSDARPDSLIISMPFHFGTSKAFSGDSVLIFLVNLSRLRQDVWSITSAVHGATFMLTYDGQSMLTGEVQGDALSGVGSNNMVTLTMDMPSFATFDKIVLFDTLMVMIMASACLIGIGMAIYAAWRIYQPLRRLYSKYIGTTQPPSNEWQTIEDLIHTTLTMNSLSQKQLETHLAQLGRQKAWLKQQLVMMLISGNDSPVIDDQIREMGYEMHHELYAILFIHIEGNFEAEEFLKDIENFSDDTCLLYAAELQTLREYAVLMNFDEDEQCQEIIELLSDALMARNLTARMQLSRSCMKMSKIAAVSIEALNSRETTLPDICNVQEEDHIKQLIAFTDIGDRDQALGLLDTMIQHIEDGYPSYLMRIYRLNILCQRIASLVYQNGLVLEDGPETGALQEPEGIADRMRRFVILLCGNNRLAQTDNAVVGYIQENCLSGEMSLSSTAQALGISTKQVSRLLRTNIDMTFKEFLTQLRMEAAKNLLRDDQPISVITEKVGYFNISHFIKSFKAYVGMTPGKWKKTLPKHP